MSYGKESKFSLSQYFSTGNTALEYIDFDVIKILQQLADRIKSAGQKNKILDQANQPIHHQVQNK